MRERETYGTCKISPTSLAANERGGVASPLSKDYSLDNFVVNRGVNTSLNNNNQQDSDDTDTSDSETKPLFDDYTRTGLDEGPSKLVRRKKNEMVLKAEPKQIRCDCHEQPKPADTAARNRLMIACVVVLIFMIGEVVG